MIYRARREKKSFFPLTNCLNIFYFIFQGVHGVLLYTDEIFSVGLINYTAKQQNEIIPADISYAEDTR